MMHPDILKAVAQTRLDDAARRGTPRPSLRRRGGKPSGGTQPEAPAAPPAADGPDTVQPTEKAERLPVGHR